MTKSELLAFMRTHRLAVEASVSASDAAQAAVVGIAVTESFELVFDTIDTTRKADNIGRNPRVAFVIGGLTVGDERTVQYEGIADVPLGSERERIKAAYFEAWPGGRDRVTWSGLVHVRVRPTWIRYSDYNTNSPVIIEFPEAQLRAWAIGTVE